MNKMMTLKQLMNHMGCDEHDADRGQMPSLENIRMPVGKTLEFGWVPGDPPGLEKWIQENINRALLWFLASLEVVAGKEGITIYAPDWEISLQFSWGELVNWPGIFEPGSQVFPEGTDKEKIWAHYEKLYNEVAEGIRKAKRDKNKSLNEISST